MLKKVIAAISALTVAMSSMLAFSVITASAASVPTMVVKASYPDGNTKAGSHIKLDVSVEGMDNYEDSCTVTAYTLYVISSDAGEYLDFAKATGDASMSFGAKNGGTVKATYNKSKKALVSSLVAMGSDQYVDLTNGQVASFTVEILKDLTSDITLSYTGSFFDTNSSEGGKVYIGEASVKNVANNTSGSADTKLGVVMAGTLDTISAIADDPEPEWVEATPIGENEGRFIGDEGFDQDEAVAYYVTLDLAQADPTITWRAKFNGSDSFLGKQISSGISDKSSGEVKFGMVIDGMKGKTVSNVGAIWGAQGK